MLKKEQLSKIHFNKYHIYYNNNAKKGEKT